MLGSHKKFCIIWYYTREIFSIWYCYMHMYTDLSCQIRLAFLVFSLRPLSSYYKLEILIALHMRCKYSLEVVFISIGFLRFCISELHSSDWGRWASWRHNASLFSRIRQVCVSYTTICMLVLNNKLYVQVFQASYRWSETSNCRFQMQIHLTNLFFSPLLQKINFQSVWHGKILI